MSAPPENLSLDMSLPDQEAEEQTFELEPDSAGKPRVKKLASAISGRRYRKRQMVRIDSLRPSLAERIRRDHPDLPENARISLGELARYQMLYVEELLQQEHGEFSELDRQVAESIANQDTIAENIEDDFEEHRTFGERLSDHLASFGGSWKFLLSFAGFLALWMAYNIAKGDAFDPYPFILLNLVLSTLAAIQAPVIMMSQKRQEEKDRQRSFNDYRVNLKAELEIRHLHEKIDYLISRQWQRLSEIQQVQIEMLHQGRREKLKSPKTEGAARYRGASAGSDAE
ncbi:putative membrane protein [Rhodoblastus acidophilus]|jgi:uncharacterized membrane protein|nr:DUF1003 domain-containing protein [Rhodoblastus acidophilus]MCW2273895.1 putative membrane protein [Rhodoblastus acidophilus]